VRKSRSKPAVGAGQQTIDTIYTPELGTLSSRTPGRNPGGQVIAKGCSEHRETATLPRERLRGGKGASRKANVTQRMFREQRKVLQESSRGWSFAVLRRTSIQVKISDAPGTMPGNLLPQESLSSRAIGMEMPDRHSRRASFTLLESIGLLSR
jgi:hypothetical protein